MKKYIAPEVEIKKFAVENIMTGSESVVTPDKAITNADNGVAEVSYSELFGL